MEASIHIGNMLNSYITENRIRHTTLGNKMGISNTAIYAYEKRKSLHTKTLLHLSHALRYNFFKDIAQQLPTDYDSAGDSPLDKRLAEQDELIKNLQLENKLMRELLAK